jgi:hypothetical protein
VSDSISVSDPLCAYIPPGYSEGSPQQRRGLEVLA